MKENHGGRLLDPRLEDDRPQLLERGHDQDPDWLKTFHEFTHDRTLHGAWLIFFKLFNELFLLTGSQSLFKVTDEKIYAGTCKDAKFVSKFVVPWVNSTVLDVFIYDH